MEMLTAAMKMRFTKTAFEKAMVVIKKIAV